MARSSASTTWRAASAVLAVAASAACAAPVAEDDIAHTVQPGDTLEQLAVHYLGDHRLWVQLKDRNQVRNPRRLQPGSVLRIPAHLQPAETAQVEFVQGEVSTELPDGTRQATPLQPGQQLAEGSRLQVGQNAFVTVRLADGSVVRVQSQSDVQLRQLRRRGRNGSVQSVLEMRSGSLESSVSDRKEPARRFEIRTPMATTSVRGTEFSVRLDDTGQTATSVVHGSVAVQPRNVPAAADGPAAAALLTPGQGMAVSPDGRLGSPRRLLPAPEQGALPSALHEADILALNLPQLPGASAYEVRIASDASFTQVLRNGTFPGTQVRMPGVEDGDYYLSVRGLDAAGIPGHAAQRPITVKTQPVPPMYQQPQAGGTISRTEGELWCTKVSGVRWYRIQIAADAAFSRPVQDDSRLEECHTAAASVPAGRYFWRAASIRELADGREDQGPFGAPQAVVIADNPKAPDAASLQSRDDGPGAQLRWSGESGQTFRLQVARDLAFSSSVVVDTRLTEPAWSSTELPSGEYYVRIQTQDPSGLQSGFSTPRQIKIGGPSVQTEAGQPVRSTDGKPLSRS